MNALNDHMKAVGDSFVVDRPLSRQQIFDAESAIKNLEHEGSQRWELDPRPIPSEKYQKLKEALENLSKLPDPLPASRRNAEESDAANEWSSYAQREEERRRIIESSYRRFRTSSFPESAQPQSDHFEYEEVDFPLPTGECVKQPVAHMKDPSAPTPPYARPDVFRSGIDQTTVGTNTIINERDTILEARKRIASPDPHERDSFVAQLVAKTKPKPLVIHEGQRVSVSYFGILFPGTVVRRNMGAGTLTVRFDDNTSNDFPIHTIVL